jgi:hypothetical protein
VPFCKILLSNEVWRTVNKKHEWNV